MVITKSESSEMQLADIYHNHTSNTTSNIFSRPVVARQKEEHKVNVACTKQYDSNATLESTSSTASYASSSHHQRRNTGDTMSIWSSTKGFKADISGFQCTEQQKTLIRKNLQFYGSALFFLAVLAAALTIVDTQITISLHEKRAFVALTLTKLKNFSQHNITLDSLEQEKEEINVYESLEIGLKSFISAISFATCISLYLYYRNLYHMKIVRHFYPLSMSFFRATPLLKKFFIECVVCFVHVPPLLTTYAGFPPRLQLIVLVRLYLLGRYLKEKHELMNSPSTRFLASVTKTDLTSMFLFKTFFMQYPFQLILLAYIILLFIGGYSVWLLEQRYTYLDTVWMLIITMTTVGFGDLTPKSIFGRIIVGLAAIAGIFLMALFISLVNEALMLQRREKRILAYVENQDHTRFRKVTALNAIGSWYKYHSFVNKHLPSRDSTSESLISKLSHHHAKTKVDFIVLARAKVLETQMFKAINQWRKVKEAQVSGYFAQEFMIEDMKIMMVDLTSKVDDIEKKMGGVTKSLDSISQLAPASPHIKKRCKSKEFDSQHSNGQIGKKIGSTEYSSSEKNNFHKNTGNTRFQFDLQHDSSDFYFEADRKMNDRVGYRGVNPLSKLLQENKNGGHNKIHLQSSDIQMAFKLLQNQAKIMNSSLDDIYYKTKQDISDLENIVSSLLICSENNTNSAVTNDLKV